MRKLPINKKTRFKIYKAALALLKSSCDDAAQDPALKSGFCLLFDYIGQKYPDYTCTSYYTIKNYLEVMKYLPYKYKDCPTGVWWFEPMSDPEGKQKRIQILEEILKK